MARSTRFPLALLAAPLFLAPILLPAPAEAGNRQLACQMARLKADARLANSFSKCRAAYYKSLARGASWSQANSDANACSADARARFDDDVVRADAKAERDGGCRGTDPDVFSRGYVATTLTESALYYAYEFATRPDVIAEKAHKIGAAFARALYSAEAADLRKRDDARRTAKVDKAIASYKRSIDKLAQSAAKLGKPFDSRTFDLAVRDIPGQIETAARIVGTRALENMAMGLVAHWSFDASDPGRNHSPTASPATLDLVFQGNAHVSPGLFGESLTLDGNGDYARVVGSVANKALEAKGAITIAAWFRATGPGSSTGAGGIIVNKEGEYEIARFPDGYPNYAIAAPGNFWSWSNAGSRAPLNTWSLVILQVEPGQITNYWATGGYSRFFTTTFPFGDAHPGEDEFRIGGRQNQSQYFQGQIDEVSIWNRPLEVEEALALGNGGRGLPLVWGLEN